MSEQIVFEGIFDKKIEVEFTKDDMSSDSGLLMFKPIISKLKISERISNIINDPRNQLLVTHEQKDLVEQRLALMLCGYNDLNDNDFLRNDPVFKLFSKGATSSLALASTPTMFRFDDRATVTECKRLLELQVHLFLERNKERFEKEYRENGSVSIHFHLDPTDIETYGTQQLALFSGYYKETCFLPLVITDGNNGDLICGILRPGNKHACWCLSSILTRLFKMIEQQYKNVSYDMKADSGFQSSEFLEFLDRQKNMTYEIALISNKNLNKMVKDYYQDAEIVFEEEKILKTYQEFGYKAGTWSRFRRIVSKTEINRHGCDVRFVVTNKKTSPLETIEDYHSRCNIENRIKELKSYAGGSRLSANEFSSNFFRFNLSCFVVICFQEFKKKLIGEKFENCYISTIRDRFIKIAGIIKTSTRRILLQLSMNHPMNRYWPQLLTS